MMIISKFGYQSLSNIILHINQYNSCEKKNYKKFCL